jgi:hypothetical protein
MFLTPKNHNKTSRERLPEIYRFFSANTWATSSRLFHIWGEYWKVIVGSLGPNVRLPIRSAWHALGLIIDETAPSFVFHQLSSVFRNLLRSNFHVRFLLPALD